jgi:hypothetical protein
MLSKGAATRFASLRGWRFAGVALLVVWLLAFLLQQGHLYQNLGLTNHKATASLPPPPSESTASSHAYSIKPIAYIFPQFHPIPENDEFWGVNFTEWTNVNKVTHNAFGLETLRPTKEVGYYNLLDYSARARQAQLIRDSGFYGVAYHHYWFGRPVMDKVLIALLEDGQPDVPFVLSWANEP